jgi:glycosyltransferase involved in cell wall biosynthesis
MQVVDSLQLGGMELVAVNFANLLAERGVRSHLCSTRAGGPLESRLSPRVTHLDLERKGRIDLASLRRLVGFIRQQQVDIIHAHGTSLFFSALAAFFAPRVKLIWHVHFGRFAAEERPARIYRLAAKRIVGVIAVNQPLAQWARAGLRFPADRVWYVPNFVVEPASASPSVPLPGTPGKRIVCVANLRPEKDHLMLVEAMKEVTEADPSATLLLVGNDANQAHATKVKERIHQHALQNNIVLLGSRSDVGAILRECDIGVLSSASEGMPLAPLEYGMAGLPTVATRVGQVPEVLDEERAGVLVAPGQPGEMATALLKLLRSAELRARLGGELKRRVREKYSEAAAMREVLRIYETVLGPPVIRHASSRDYPQFR